MFLSRMFGRKPAAETAEATVPTGAPTGAPVSGPVDVAAPLAGRLIDIGEVPDPVFAGRVLGDGIAIDPDGAVLHAPFDGRVTGLHEGRHAINLRAANGTEVLIHIGIDTVGLHGHGFHLHVAEGAQVGRGAPLVTFEPDVIRPKARSMVVLMIVTNGESWSLRDLREPGPVGIGEICCRLAPVDEATDASPLSASLPMTVPATRAPAETAIVRRIAEIRDPFGLHARPAGVVADHAKKSPVPITVSLGGRQADARSAVSLMVLGAHCGDLLTIEAQGQDGAAAVDAIVAFLGTPTAAGEDRPAAEEHQAAPVAVNASPLPFGEPVSLRGVTAAPGQAVGHTLRLVREDLAFAATAADPAAETAALEQALVATRARIAALIAELGDEGERGRHGGKQAEILGAHLSFLDDPFLKAAADRLIASGKSAPFAWKAAVDEQITALRGLGNRVLAERATDLEDIQRRVLLQLLGRTEERLRLGDRTVLIADDLLPSQFAELELDRVAGICLAASGPTSHVAILAASRGIPAVVAIGPDALRVQDGQAVIIDAGKADVWINPPSDSITSVERAITVRRARLAEARAAAGADCRTTDGVRIEVVANLGSLADAGRAMANGAEGCGLLRSEFLFLDRTEAPDEDEQYREYQAITTALEGRPTIIRTLDAGADKDVPYIHLPADENPALGLRGIRTSLWQPEILRTQVRAILRVEPFGTCRILLPMIATLADFRTVKTVIEAERIALGRETPIEVGVMVEVPSAALTAKRFAREVDFFSVGTNDLTQYALAMDRCNPRLAQQLDPFHPAVLRLIADAAEGAATHGRWIGVCGNLASYPIAAPLLIGLGVTELSAGPEAIPEIKAAVRKLIMPDCIAVAKAALDLDDGEAVRSLLATHWPEL
ncbi:phosphoenolpyruvate--protein phosphotransferase (plasmid) [Azospirillum sp. A26]|uniref:phosphoenolpyruvate--protein phosphotransferase n=1 Tax=Azospirillum sp. A26 TaxID=3160607 RepID=UPI0036701DC9